MASTREQLINSILLAQELLTRKAKTDYRSFVHYSKKDYQMMWFHGYICDKLNEFAQGLIKKLMILMPPQHGKSELATRLLPPFVLGQNPNKKIAIASYSDTHARSFNRAIQRYIDNERYGALFPDTRLNYSRIFHTNFDNYSRTTEKFEIVKQQGFVRTVGRGGALTGETVDLGIIDDLYKDRAEATSVNVSQTTYDWYVDVFSTRLHNDSQQLLMNTRWDENDLAGRLLIEEPGQWEVIKFPAIKTEDIIPYDPRDIGEALWEEKHSLDKILGIKNLNEVSFNSLYQQDPGPNRKLVIYDNWIEVPEWPTDEEDVISWGLDFGKTTGINCLVKHNVNGKKAWFHECCYESGLSTTNIAEILKGNGYNGEPVYCDHEETKIAELRSKGIAAFKALKGPGTIDAGINKIKEFSVHYTASSHNLSRELKAYIKLAIGNIITNQPDPKCRDHAMDACRYANYSRHFRAKQ